MLEIFLLKSTQLTISLKIAHKPKTTGSIK